MRKTLLILMCFLLLSCEKDLNIDFPFEGERFLIFGELVNNRPVEIGIDKTYPPSGYILFNNEFLKTTEVELLKDGSLFEKLSRKSDSSYLFTSKIGTVPEVGHFYQLRISSKDIPTALSFPEALLPQPIIDSVWTEMNEINSPQNPSKKAKVLNIAVSNNSDKVPYFLFEIYPMSGERETSAGVISSEKLEELDNPCMYTQSSKMIFHKASCYNSTTVVFSFYVESTGTIQSKKGESVQDFKPTLGQVDRVVIKASSVNESYFKYYFDNNEPLSFFSVFEGVNPTFSTFENGYGAILTKNVVYREINL